MGTSSVADGADEILATSDRETLLIVKLITTDCGFEQYSVLLLQTIIQHCMK